MVVLHTSYLKILSIIVAWIKENLLTLTKDPILCRLYPGSLPRPVSIHLINSFSSERRYKCTVLRLLNPFDPGHILWIVNVQPIIIIIM